MHTNLLIAINNLVREPITNIISHYRSTNKINLTGDPLEFYIKDLFCNSFNENNIEKKNELYNIYFSYFGNQNNPPDIIIKKGDAIEVKKIQSFRSGIALNSSYPKDKLFSDGSMITAACRNCEEWQVKDLIYIIGVINEKKLRNIWFIYGDCYAASKEIYEGTFNIVRNGINGLGSIELS